jgi:hypothetical protein
VASLPASGTVEKVCLPSLLLGTLHVRAMLSSSCPVRTSSQSFDLALEKDMEVTGGNLSDARGMDSDVAFFDREPTSISMRV